MSIYDEVRAERERAHAKHGPTSMEVQPWHDGLRQHILVEEVGEVAKEFNEARHRGDEHPHAARLRKELIQVAAMATAWADAIPLAGDDGEPCVCGTGFTCVATEHEPPTAARPADPDRDGEGRA